MKRLRACAVLLALPGLAHAGTTLTLSATGSIPTAPDEIVASLTAQATAAKPATAQAEVNAAIAKALAAARSVATVVVSTGSYTVYQTTQPPQAEQYQASQTLSLTMPAAGTPPPAFMTLVGSLQQNGLLLNNLNGDLSPSGQAGAQSQAIAAALHQLQSQAARIAATLGQHVAGITSLSVDGNSAMPLGRMMAMSASTPSAAPGPVTVTATVTATVALSQ